MTETPLPPSRTQAPVRFLELELTNRCQLRCTHCYARSAPTEGHGAMTLQDWNRLLDDAPAAGISHVQLIGGEPTLHPGFALMLTHALDSGLKVEVFSNLLHITGPLWDLLTHPGVGLATSYYSDAPAQHDKITGRPGSHRRTLAAIGEALRRGIPLRAGIIDLGDGQRVEQARTELERLGVTRIRVDRMRRVGRATEHRVAPPAVGELCGRCGDGRAAVSCDGDVRLCVLSRFLPSAGNVRTTPLADILRGRKWRELCARVPHHRATTTCNPDSDSNDCAPAETIYESEKAPSFL